MPSAMVCYAMEVLIGMCSNQTVSSNMTEQADLMLAALAALKETQQDHKGVKGRAISPISFVDESDSPTAMNVVPPLPTPKPEMSLEGQGIDAENHEACVSGLATHSRTNGSREFNLQDQHPFTNASIAAVQIPESPSVGANDKLDAEQLRPQESAASVSRNPPDPEVKTDLIFATVKPRVHEHIASIELIWSVQEIKMQASAVHMYMEQHKGNGPPAIFDTLHNLRHQELTMLDHLLGLGTLREASLLFLKRTKTDIRHDTIYLQSRSRSPNHRQASVTKVSSYPRVRQGT